MPGKARSKPEQKASLIQWAAHRFGVAVEHVGINHCGSDISMPKQFLNGKDVISDSSRGAFAAYFGPKLI